MQKTKADSEQMPIPEGHFRFENDRIVECALEIRFTSDGFTEDSIFEQMTSAFEGAAYPEIVPFKIFEAQIQLGEEASQAHQKSTEGRAFHSEDKKRTFQVRNGAFLFSQLAPYNSWKEFSIAAVEVWSTLENLLSGSKIDRIGVRTINQFDFINSASQAKQFLKFGLDLPLELEDSEINAFGAVELQPDKNGLGAKIIEAFRPGESGSDLILDIDVYWNNDSNGSDPVPVSECLKSIRDFKNMIFISIITPEMDVKLGQKIPVEE